MNDKTAEAGGKMKENKTGRNSKQKQILYFASNFDFQGLYKNLCNRKQNCGRNQKNKEG